MKGAPIRLEIGLRDIQKNCATIARRDNGEKITINKIKIADEVILMLDDIQKNLFKQALKFREDSTFEVDSYDDFKKIIKETGGFVRCGWDGNKETEQAIKDETKATIRVIPFDENPKDLLCIYSGKPAKHEVIFAKAY
jgi:prolyl-tRNA synthetase